MLAVHLTKARQPVAPDTQPKSLGVSWIPSLYLHRFLRLTPLYFFVLGCYYYLMRVVDQGPWWGLLERDYDLCAQYWWTNLLYINTLYPWGATLDMCYPVSWYMSVDFQLFLLVPFLVLAYVVNKRLGYLLPALLWTASTAYAYVLGYVYNTSEFALQTGA
jgi:peptidoglycan/LPS O-acetylase OafA/YrhL